MSLYGAVACRRGVQLGAGKVACVSVRGGIKSSGTVYRNFQSHSVKASPCEITSVPKGVRVTNSLKCPCQRPAGWASRHSATRSQFPAVAGIGDPAVLPLVRVSGHN
ncbi:hypothetical protein E2C01_100575 [Portunus trituberculatus]|uniref:Uncharacterized protein n=1 Tax=Portunus trituberculatus TaxID=210409 RepID=A0A5B7KDM7_PORTR|nr:hypothetical protein [Portunus trituberculatus]